MTIYRAYTLELIDPAGREVLHVRTWPELRSTLSFLASNFCTHADDQHPSDGITLRVEWVWFEDGFVCPPPSDFAISPAVLVSACPAAILGAL